MVPPILLAACRSEFVGEYFRVFPRRHSSLTPLPAVTAAMRKRQRMAPPHVAIISGDAALLGGLRRISESAQIAGFIDFYRRYRSQRNSCGVAGVAAFAGAN